jgi:hypothetical protein
MSGTQEDDDDVQTHVNGNGGAISDDDVRAMLAQEQKERKRLKAELDQERTSRTRAEATANTHQNARFDAEEAAVTARLGTAEAEATGLKKLYAEALAEGRFEEAAEVQDKMGELRARQAQDKQYQTWLTGEKARAAEQAKQQPVHEGVDLAQYSPAQRKWIKANPEFMDDPKVRAKTYAGHQWAVAEEVEVDSKEYFEIIEDFVNRGRRVVKPEDDEIVVQREPPRRREPPQDMPVTRRTPETTNDRRKEIRLSADEREASDISMPDVPIEGRMDKDGNWQPGRYERYGLQRAKLRAQGRG